MKQKIKILPDQVVNKIAAGEVIERPSSVVKELVENSLDANANKIEIHVRGGGKTEIIVIDDGMGISKDEVFLSVKRHATSKLTNENLVKISTLGFRGEALSSISSVSDFTLSTNNSSCSEGYEITFSAGSFQHERPINHIKGTTIKVKNLFFNMPARLKFLKSDNYELLLIKRLVQKFSLSFLNTEFNIFVEGKKVYSTDPIKERDRGKILYYRSSKIFGRDFKDNSVEINIDKQNFKLTGLLGIPTFNFSNSNNIFFFVNNRIVSDKSITSILKVAYRDFLAYDRFPQLILFVNCSPSEVDVNVHPMKHEVRFRNIQQLKSLIISSIREELRKINHLASSSNTNKALKKFTYEDKIQDALILREKKEDIKFDEKILEEEKIEKSKNLYPLGFAKTQLHDTYIISENEKGIIIIDQHAAHERIVYEKLKKEFYSKNVKRQILLIPLIIELDNLVLKNVEETIKNAEKYGVKVETFGSKSLIVREVPMILANSDIKKLVMDLIDGLIETNDIDSIEEKINKICSSMACHGSIRAGRIMEIDEMNDLLRKMEKTAFSGQCNHGRPTYVELKLNDIEKLFGRK